MARPRVVVVDHHDSYTWNLVHLVAAVTGRLPTVVQHDEVAAAALAGFSHVVLSPGPGHPSDPADFAVGREVILGSDVPVLGVCLGMQGLVVAYGGHVGQVEPAHGDVARVCHDGTGVFAGLPSPFDAVRYHSLAAVALPDVLVETAWCAGVDGPVVMGVAHRDRPQWGVQFHPESVLTEHGEQLIGHLPGLDVNDPVQRFGGLAASYERMFWLDGGGARSWSGRRSILGYLRDDDVSLTYDATVGEVRRHASGRSTWSATTRSRSWPSTLRATAATRRSAGSATSATPPAPTCRRAPAAVCPTRCGCGSGTRCSSRTTTRPWAAPPPTGDGTRSRRSTRTRSPGCSRSSGSATATRST